MNMLAIGKDGYSRNDWFCLRNQFCVMTLCFAQTGTITSQQEVSGPGPNWILAGSFSRLTGVILSFKLTIIDITWEPDHEGGQWWNCQWGWWSMGMMNQVELQCMFWFMSLTSLRLGPSSSPPACSQCVTLFVEFLVFFIRYQIIKLSYLSSVDLQKRKKLNVCPADTVALCPQGIHFLGP